MWGVPTVQTLARRTVRKAFPGIAWHRALWQLLRACLFFTAPRGIYLALLLGSGVPQGQAVAAYGRMLSAAFRCRSGRVQSNGAVKTRQPIKKLAEPRKEHIVDSSSLLLVGHAGVQIGSCGKLQKMTTPIQRLDCGKRLSEACIHVANKTVYLAGQVPEDTTQDAKGQTAQCLKAIDDLLARAGTNKSHILMAQIFLKDIADFAQMNEAWDAWVPEGASPSRATVAGVVLADPGWKVEIVVTAALP